MAGIGGLELAGAGEAGDGAIAGVTGGDSGEALGGFTAAWEDFAAESEDFMVGLAGSMAAREDFTAASADSMAEPVVSTEASEAVDTLAAALDTGAVAGTDKRGVRAILAELLN